MSLSSLIDVCLVFLSSLIEAHLLSPFPLNLGLPLSVLADRGPSGISVLADRGPSGISVLANRGPSGIFCPR